MVKVSNNPVFKNVYSEILTGHKGKISKVFDQVKAMKWYRRRQFNVFPKLVEALLRFPVIC